MKVGIFFVIPWMASGAVLRERQEDFNPAQMLQILDSIARIPKGPVTPIAGIDLLKSQIVTNKVGVQRTLTKLGPLKINGASTNATSDMENGHSHGGMGMGSDPTLSGQNFLLNIADGLCNHTTGCTVLSGKAGVMFTDGTEATTSKGIYIHHILTSNRSKPDHPFLSACENPIIKPINIAGLGVGTGFVGAGEDSSSAFATFTNRNVSSGFHMKKSDQFSTWAMLVNYNPEPVEVYITYDLEWLPGLVGDDVSTTLIGIQQCPNRMIRLSEEGPTTTKSGKWTVLENGKLVFARGHLHDGGESVSLLLNDKPVCQSKATYGGEKSTAKIGDQEWKTISGMSECKDSVPLIKGDTLALAINYDLKKYPLRKSLGGKDAGVMGMFAISFENQK